jgi:predicted metal-dependent hydrolase
MPEFPVEVIRSSRRKKTVQASLVEGRIRVMVPAGLSAEDERRLVDRVVARAAKKRSSTAIDLERRARDLAARLDLPLPLSIAWSERQTQRWGSCTPSDGSVRISSQLTGVPGWVLDYVIVHELAHLIVPEHNGEFRSLVDRYPLAERARGYLIALGERG